MNRRIIGALLGMGISFITITHTFAAPITAYTVPSTNGWTQYGGQSFMVGYDFTPSVNITVTSLGILDWFADGLVASSEIGIWDSSSTLLASATLPAGITNPQNAGAANTAFFFTSIAPLTLTAGTTYRIANQMTGGPTEVVGYDGVYVPAPDISFGKGWGSFGTTFVNPNTFSNSTPYMGAVFQYTVTAVPEPTSAAFLLAGAASLWLIRKRK